jgi:hypothetical protein
MHPRRSPEPLPARAHKLKLTNGKVSSAAVPMMPMAEIGSHRSVVRCGRFTLLSNQFGIDSSGLVRRAGISRNPCSAGNVFPGRGNVRLADQRGKQMRHANASENSRTAAPPRNRRNSPSEQTDEAPGLIEREYVEVERDIPADDNQPIEGNQPLGRPEPPAFEE